MEKNMDNDIEAWILLYFIGWVLCILHDRYLYLLGKMLLQLRSCSLLESAVRIWRFLGVIV